ncbi:MAG TPA: 50S ribosomal protein L29 [Thiothrix sp.]|nr:50S ribosomal protein L29 [Thiothrix sp.]
MKTNELREKTLDELKNELIENRKEQFALKMQQASGQLQRPSEMKRVRKQIARIKTIITEKRNAGA